MAFDYLSFNVPQGLIFEVALHLKYYIPRNNFCRIILSRKVCFSILVPCGLIPMSKSSKDLCFDDSKNRILAYRKYFNKNHFL